MTAAHGYLLLCLVLGFDVLVHPVLGAPQTVAGSPQGSATAHATSSHGTAISGTVRDQSGTPLRWVKVKLTNEQTSRQSVAVTSENGVYVFTPVEAGTYTLATELSGFENGLRQHVTVNGYQHLNVEFSLASKPSGSSTQGMDAGAVPGRQRASSEQLLSHFDYDERPNYKPGEVASSTEPGGYSAGANADSYDLILDYVESERPADQRNEAERGQEGLDHPAQAESRSLREGRRSAVEDVAPEARNENQFFSHGSDLLLHHKFAPAVELFQRGVARFPDSAKLQTGLGVALYACGLYDQAVSVLVQATDMVPSDPRPYLLLGKAYNLSRSRNDEVVKRLERLVKLDPESAGAHYYYALSLWRGSQGKPGGSADEVERLLKSAVELDPRFVDARLELGALYAEQEKYSDAIREYRQAIAMNPDLAAAHYRLAQTYERTGDRAAAQTELALYEHLQQKKSVDTQ
jgi:tetratricopeptide (TPR) repeat protein